MKDAGHEAAERSLREIEQQVREVYAQAAKDAQNKLEGFLEGFARRDEAKRALVDAGKLSFDDYTEWRKNQVLVSERWRDMANTLAQDLTNADKIAMSVVNGHLPDVYAVNANYGTYQIEHGLGANTSFTLYDRQTVERLIREQPNLLPRPSVDIAKDLRWNKQYINNSVTQALLQGESIDKLADRIFPEIMSKTDLTGKTKREIESIIRRNELAALRNARTAVTGAQNAGRVDAYKRAENMGITMKQEWLAAHDGHTRESHAEIDGEQVEVGGTFSNGCAYPGDPGGPPEEVYNCRCTLIPVLASLDQIKDTDENLKDMSFDEWENAHTENIIESIEKNDPGYSVADIESPVRPRRHDYDDYDSFVEARESYNQQKEIYNQQIDNAIEIATQSSRFTSTNELTEWANKNGISIDSAVIGAVDIQSFNEVAPVLEEMFERFPEVKSYSFEYFDGTTYTTNFSVGLTDDGLLSANGGFNFNPRYFSDYSVGLREALEQQTDGTLVRGDGTFGSLVRHEYGHNVQNYIEMKMADKYHEHVDDWRLNFSTFDEMKNARESYHAEFDEYRNDLLSLIGKTGQSEYSNTNTLELFAEGFSEYTSGSTSEFGVAFGEFLKRWY